MNSDENDDEHTARVGVGVGDSSCGCCARPRAAILLSLLLLPALQLSWSHRLLHWCCSCCCCCCYDGELSAEEERSLFCTDMAGHSAGDYA